MSVIYMTIDNIIIDALKASDTRLSFFHKLCGNDKCCKVTDSFMINMKWRLEQYNEYRMLIWEK